jgi:hypothetical protein
MVGNLVVGLVVVVFVVVSVGLDTEGLTTEVTGLVTVVVGLVDTVGLVVVVVVVVGFVVVGLLVDVPDVVFPTKTELGFAVVDVGLRVEVTVLAAIGVVLLVKLGRVFPEDAGLRLGETLVVEVMLLGVAKLLATRLTLVKF